MKVAIVGTAPSSRHLTPFNDPSWQIWGCSPGNKGAFPRCDAWFALYPLRFMLAPERREWGEPYIQWLATMKFPVFMWEHNQEVPTSVPFPKDELIKEFGDQFFTSTPAWMLAKAIRDISLAPKIKGEPPHEIALFGIDMAADNEYAVQKPGCLHFLNIAKERGIHVHLPLESDLSSPGQLYGWSENTAMGVKLNARQREIEDRLANERRTFETSARNVAFLEGALDDIRYTIRTWVQ